VPPIEVSDFAIFFMQLWVDFESELSCSSDLIRTAAFDSDVMDLIVQYTLLIDEPLV
jgi:hypothetical protein